MEKSSPDFTLYPLLWLAICFSSGILTANFLAFDWKIYLAGCLIFAVFTIVFLKRKISVVFLALAFFAVGAFCFQSKNQSIAENRLKNLYDKNIISSGDPIEIEGVLQTKPELSVGGFFLELKAERAIYKTENLDVSGKVRLFAIVPNEQIAAEYEALNLEYGSRIRVACRLEREDEFLNPGVVSKKEILDQKEIDATATIKSPLLIENLGNEKTFAPLAWIYERRQELIVDFKNNFNSSTAGILIASLLGNRYFLDKQTAEIFREGGTFHVLVISGLHITFIGGLTLLFIRFFTTKRLWQFRDCRRFSLGVFVRRRRGRAGRSRHDNVHDFIVFAGYLSKGKSAQFARRVRSRFARLATGRFVQPIISSDIFERHFDCRNGFSADRKFKRNRQLVAFV